MPSKSTVLHWRLQKNRNLSFKVSRIFYAVQKHAQYQAIVKLLGSFRLTALNRHLHRYCIFTELVPETVLQSLHHSCASELHLCLLLLREGSDYIFISTLFAFPLSYISFYLLDSCETQDSLFFASPFFLCAIPFALRSRSA